MRELSEKFARLRKPLEKLDKLKDSYELHCSNNLALTRRERRLLGRMPYDAIRKFFEYLTVEKDMQDERFPAAFGFRKNEQDTKGIFYEKLYAAVRVIANMGRTIDIDGRAFKVLG